MEKEDAIKYLQQLYPNGGHCWLDEQRIEAIGMVIKALQEEPESKQNLSNVQRTVKNLNEDFENALAEEWKGYNDRGAAKVDALEDNTQELAFAKGFYRGWHYKKENPISEDLEDAASMYAKEEYNHKSPATLPDRCKGCYAPLMYAFKAGAQWQKAKDESCSKDLGGYINELSKQFQEVSFAKLSRIAVRVANWKEQQFEKNRIAACDRQTEEEAEREQDFVMGIIECEHRQPTFDDAIKYGMRLQRENMMKDATDVTVHIEAGNYPYIPQMELYDYDKDIPLAKEGDKYKVVLVKED